MRLRYKPGAKERLMSYPQYVIYNVQERKGKWQELFGNDHEIHVEIGTGKGKFLTEMAKANPHINYIGIEAYDSVIISALDRLIEADLPNLKLLNLNANKLEDYFASGEISRIYLNFSDPWPKNKHAKRRLTYKSFLKMYENVLVPQGEIHFKTDNQALFEFSLVSFSHYGMKLNYISLDLHNSDFEGNIMTEYEEKFSSMGHRIYRCEVQFPKK
ncbi:tRNA (guanosine(46)-N7)-methyltransferase TrmB [Caldibacillus lycopersici]|uniref:tRNA (guanine-N(7)-)-methyltransferase n=1 Tax=Perspicuibacillus lycopersici TaxID=1325689 RepID=A0AAE3IY89_9BACI|nr:tRNA (guanosine(46)-N7)-methyltransferase TrmB [Perspicuibacillus lycopersici]MCU9614250.1 tRNA (guanosine(46)-N7)-methyltransferase TrmB [Perspicuibacillus lycopersici]